MSVDNSGLLALIDEYALGKGDCLGHNFEAIASREAPHLTGRLADGVQASGAVGGGGLVVNTVESTTRGDQGFDYGVVQNDGTGPIQGNPVLAFEVDGQMIFARSTSGVPGSHWWDNTVDAWSEIVAMCEG